jgi:hypothetical protein
MEMLFTFHICPLRTIYLTHLMLLYLMALQNRNYKDEILCSAGPLASRVRLFCIPSPVIVTFETRRVTHMGGVSDPEVYQCRWPARCSAVGWTILLLEV